MIQKLPIGLAQVKVSNTTENLLNEILQITCSFTQAKEITKKVYNNKMNLIKVKYKIDTIFMNSENSKMPDPHRFYCSISQVK